MNTQQHQALTPQEIATAAFLHIPPACISSETFPEEHLLYPTFSTVIKQDLPAVRYCIVRSSIRSATKKVVEVVFREATAARDFAKAWATRLPKRCNGVVVRPAWKGFSVSVPIITS